jgi:hypothetical protein
VGKKTEMKEEIILCKERHKEGIMKKVKNKELKR